MTEAIRSKMHRFDLGPKPDKKCQHCGHKLSVYRRSRVSDMMGGEVEAEWVVGKCPNCRN